MDCRATDFDESWMEAACHSVAQSRNLRQAITLAAAHLITLLELEIESNGWDQGWKAQLGNFCAEMPGSMEEPTDDDLAFAEWAWGTGEEIIRIYEKLNHLSDWELYSEVCLEGDAARDEVADKMRFGCECFGAALAYIHGWVTRN